MSTSNIVNRTILIAGTVVVLAVWPAAFASAHSVGQCIKDVKSFCGADMDCYWAGAPLCFDHNHPGSAGNANTLDPNFATEQRHNFSKANKSRKFRAR